MDCVTAAQAVTLSEFASELCKRAIDADHADLGI